MELTPMHDEEEESLPFEERYGHKLVDVNTLVSAVKKIRHAYDTRYKELEDLYEAKYKTLRKEVLESKSLSIEAAAGSAGTGGNVVAAGMVQLGKDLEQMDKAWSSWQNSQTNRAESMGREIKSLREQNKTLNQSLYNWQGEVKMMHSELVQLKAMWENLPGIIQSVVNAVVKALPTPQASVTIPEEAIKSLIQVVLPTRLKMKKFTYLEDGRPDTIEEIEKDSDEE
jgi:hypothetical protein